MEPKGFTGAPFGIQTARFDVSAIYPNVKRPSTFLQAPYSRIVCSDLNRKLGPGTYSIDYGGFSSTIMQQKRMSSSSWAKAQEAARLTQMPHFNFKEIGSKGKALKEKLGPGTYNYTDFLQLQEKRPHSNRGICDTGEVRFKDRIRECYPGPGTYGNPYALLEEKQKRSVTALGIMDSKTSKCFAFPNVGSGLGPGSYNLKNGMDEMLKCVVSTRGPYEIFTGDRSKPIICGHYATDKKSEELSGSNVKSFLEELETKEKKKHGIFSTLVRSPRYPAERIFWSTVGLGPHEQFLAGPGSYDIIPSKRTEYGNQPPFWIGTKRFDRKAYRLFFGNANPVGVGRYDTTKHEKYPKKIKYRSLYMSDTQRYLSNLERDKCLQERITPVNKGYWGNPLST
ncbi:ciliary microtubule-associated protein 2 [Rhineura floridana]|uniref:ciliary microtubule-associated protein 2 n=1 Tax=Rhineura floridana TaxID=261503 RepID=UPI002AC82276|nr:ciliary microtubule-associated protein 2 [Rhineura floridana]